MSEQQTTIEPIVPQEEEDTLQTLLTLVRRQESIEAEIAGYEENLTAAKAALRNVTEQRIPDLLLSLGLRDLTLANGNKLMLVDHYYAHVSKANAPAAFAWLKENNMDGIIKRKLIINESSKELMAELALGGVDFELDERIHPSTLKAFTKEQLLEDNPEFPRQLFSASVTTKSKIA